MHGKASGQDCAITIVVLAKDEERCIARCLDSVVGHGFDILVIDTGSEDATGRIVAAYADRGVQLRRIPWPNSFAKARNSAFDMVSEGWIVFLDADEWLTERAAIELPSHLASASSMEGSSRRVFAPKIIDEDSGKSDDAIPRIFLAENSIRFRGPVHEYPVVAGNPDTRVGLAGLDLEFRHDGYHPAITQAKRKLKRNLGLLRIALANEPDNPRWLYFIVRDGFVTLGREHIVEACTRLRELASAGVHTADLLSARDYRALTLPVACQALIALGDLRTVYRYCDELDEMKADNPDAHYLRSMADLSTGAVTAQHLLRTVRLRKDDVLMGRSTLDPAGGHLDALIVVLLRRFRGKSDAERYLGLCEPWTDMFFDRSEPRTT
ncbi:MAG TPA: glycosyltransferase [Vicinamibacterales bacterium]|nr:glycosyltransferase [Vicinamibacterales bacterium]